MKTLPIAAVVLAFGFVAGVAATLLTLVILLGADEPKQAPKVDHKKTSEAIQKKLRRIERQ